MEFKEYPKIKHWNQIWVTITQKLHGTNAQIVINGNEIQAGSRTRFLSIENDNYGFARFVNDNSDELIKCLGDGTHYGEWCGPGINSGEGLKEKSLFLFNWSKFGEVSLPPRVHCIPVLYEGPFVHSIVDEVMSDLKQNGSRVVPGFMKVEGVVIKIGKEMFKSVFDTEETAWKDKKVREERTKSDHSHLLQKLRLEKLISRDENYLREFPNSLPLIVKDYITDLNSEIEDEELKKEISKNISRDLFRFIKTEIEKGVYKT